MVITFYPGGGGNRYLRMLSGKEFSSPGVTYDRRVFTQPFKFRYLLDDQDYDTSNECILTHCVNASRIRECIGDADQIVYIVSDLKQSLCREWSLEARFRNNQRRDVILEAYNSIRAASWPDLVDSSQFALLPAAIRAETKQFIAKHQDLFDNTYNEINSAYSTIIWHQDYYEKYPYRTSDTDVVINIETDPSQFAQVMRDELNRYPSELFNLAWEVATQYGKDAPVMDIFKDRFPTNE